MSPHIPLTRGYSALVDDADHALVNQSKWLYVGSGYAGRFVTIDGKKKLLYLHRFLLNAQPDQRVDHINGDRLDCRRANLRLATTKQNVQNRRCATRSTSGKKGVCWHKGMRKWHVRITAKGTRLHLGYHDDLETAARLYDAAAKHFFGAYARPNYPEEFTPPAIGLLLAQILARRARRDAPSEEPSLCGENCALCPKCHDHAGEAQQPGAP